MRCGAQRIQIKDTFIHCSNLIFTIEGMNLVRFGYDCGFGEKEFRRVAVCRFINNVKIKSSKN